MVQGKVSDHFSNIVVGGGLCGAALAYELAKQGQQVLLVDAGTAGATRYSYGGIAYWAGNTPLTQALCRAARSRHPQLSEELGHNTQFRERELLLFVEPGRDGAAIAQTYQDCLEPPQVLTADEAWEREPLLCKAGIGGALAVNHGHVDPIAMTLAYQRAFERLGGERYLGQVTGLGQQGELWVRTGLVDGKTVTGEPVTEETIIRGDRILLSAGAWSRNLLAQAGIHLPLYFSHGEMIELPRAALEQADLRMQRLVMPAEQVRFGLEAEASQPGFASRWGEAEHPAQAGQELMPPVLDAGVIQFLDGRAAMGQISRLQASLGTTANPSQSEAAMRQKLGKSCLRSPPSPASGIQRGSPSAAMVCP
ncbi:MAG: FAD-binding oxidoreductase [Synechococcales cyanobacterium RM1_1_8]|nr:FAD-binding oxidoreductase [Synechococcales cyanobacterium RM1_1_8]